MHRQNNQTTVEKESKLAKLPEFVYQNQDNKMVVRSLLDSRLSHNMRIEEEK